MPADLGDDGGSASVLLHEIKNFEYDKVTSSSPTIKLSSVKPPETAEKSPEIFPVKAIDSKSIQDQGAQICLRDDMTSHAVDQRFMIKSNIPMDS